MRNSIFDVSSYLEMTMSNQEASCESRIEKMRKFLSSPLTRKKPSGSQTKTFGTTLDVLIQRTPSESCVPFIVTRICQYIENTGLMHEGLFRISGNARLIEKLRLCFDQSGDAPLETEGDVASAAALLKLFLRELPDPIIPLNMHQQFLNAVKGNDRQESTGQLITLVEKLPFANFNLLKYLSFFLMQVSQFEEQNRMSASSLGIVFGPNLFRVSEDFGGLKEQSLTNQIVTYFITDYYTIFRTEPDSLTKFNNHLTLSLDEGMKQSSVAIDANNSMVSSWPKLSSYASLMPSINLRPLSVSIPTMDDYPLGSLAENLNSEDHVLIANSSSSEDQKVPPGEQISDQSEKEDNSANTSSSRRKRKERKLVKEDIVASYTTLDSLLHINTKPNAEDLDVFMEEKSLMSEASSLQLGSRGIGEGLLSTASEQFAYMDSDQNDQAAGVDVLQSSKHVEQISDSTEINSRPFYFGSGLKSSSQESTHSESSNDTSYKQNHNSCKSSKQSHDSFSYYEMASTSYDVNNFQENRMPSYPQVDYSRRAKYTDLPESSHNSSSVQAEVHESPHAPSEPSTSSNPLGEKRFAHDSKHHRHRRGHRYYKKQHSGEAQKATKKYHDSQPVTYADACVGNGKEFSEVVRAGLKDSSTPPHDLDVISNTDDSPQNGSDTDRGYNWSIIHRLQEDELSAVSPVHEFLRVSSSAEAPLSPSAYRSYLSHRSPHLDPSLPPSPPVEQEDLSTGATDDAKKSTIKQLSKKIQHLKSKVKQFEENFEENHGYRPSYAEKSSYPEVKKLIMDLNQTRKELKEVKEEASSVGEGAPSTQRWAQPDEKFSALSKSGKRKNPCRFGLCVAPILSDGDSVTIEESLNEALLYLEEKRKSSGRPEALEEMSRDQLVEEKYTIQKLLLQFEGIHGRPTTKMHRDLMRPLYDRYRSLKRILGRSASFGSSSKLKDSVELPPILEHETMDFGTMTTRDSAEYLEVTDQREGAEVVEKSDSEIDKEINEFDNRVDDNTPPSEDGRSSRECSEPKQNIPIHELSLSELFEQQQQARTEKRRLRKILKEFEMQFQTEYGRKVQREDKREMESVYGDYKNIRARLKLLEALAAKQGQKKQSYQL